MDSVVPQLFVRLCHDDVGSGCLARIDNFCWIPNFNFWVLDVHLLSSE